MSAEAMDLLAARAAIYDARRKCLGALSAVGEATHAVKDAIGDHDRAWIDLQVAEQRYLDLGGILVHGEPTR
jgi:hypothetical protein